MHKPYEILSFRDANGEIYKLDMAGNYTNRSKTEIYELQDMLDYIDTGFIEILSVRRIQDGLIFRLTGYSICHGSIIKFDIEPVTFELCVFVNYNGNIVPIIIENI